MIITASLVKELRERTGAGMMDCKKALVETSGDAEAAAELLRKKGQASAAKKAGRIAAEGCVKIASDEAGKTVAIVEVNSETDFVAKDENFLAFAESAAQLALSEQPENVEALLAAALPGGETLEQARNNLIAKIGENIGVRRVAIIHATGQVAQYVHGSRIGAIVDLVGGDEVLGKNVEMHVAAAAPVALNDAEVPAEQLEKEKNFQTEKALEEGKPPEIVEKMITGRMRKYLAEITLVGQPFVKDPDITVGKLLENAGASVASFVRIEVGEGIEKKEEDFAAEVEAQVRASQ